MYIYIHIHAICSLYSTTNVYYLEVNPYKLPGDLLEGWTPSAQQPNKSKNPKGTKLPLNCKYRLQKYRGNSGPEGRKTKPLGSCRYIYIYDREAFRVYSTYAFCIKHMNLLFKYFE